MRRISAACAVAALAALLVHPVRAAEVVFPADAGYIDVKKDLGAKGDGVSDDTKALQAALDGSNGFVYLPNGTYLVSDTIGGAKSKRRVVQGQSRTGVVIKLKNDCLGFNNPDQPKPVLSFYDRFLDPKSSNGQAFRNSLFDVTIDVGANNPGAVGIHYFNNNQGMVENITVRTSDAQQRGKAGFALVTNWPGPALIRNLRVEGFDYGVWSTIGQYSLAFEHLTLENQRVAGIHNSRQLLSIRGLRSRNTVPALVQERGLTVLVDATLAGGKPGTAAIQNAGGLYVRNLATSGYKQAIADATDAKTTSAPGLIVAEWASRPIVNLFPTPARSLNLPVKETPVVPWDRPDEWASVTKFGAKAATGDRDTPDATAAVQKAIDAGKGTVYFPKGTYYLNDTIRVRGNVRRIIGMESTIKSGAGFAGSNKPVFRIEDGRAPVVVFERFEGGYGNQATVFFEHASSRTLVVKAAIVGGAFRGTGSGDVFLDDYCGGDLVFNKQRVWARQLNPENNGTKITNDGGTLWILNLKTEKPGTALLTRNGGKSEVLGGYIYYNRGNDGTIALVNENSDVSAIAALTGAKGPTVQETRGGETKQLERWPFLYTGYQKAQGKEAVTSFTPNTNVPAGKLK